ncbi:MAG TPA: primosomal protein N' [Caproiciproducens sp.]|nr:primosomal protein N' [Caproiciproducens sp.]
MTIAKVAVENTAYHFDKAFDYLIPEELTGCAFPGCRVLVPFGTSDTRRQGLILELGQTGDTERLKSILTVLDKDPLLSDEAVRMIYWLKEHYFCTLFEAVKLLLPTGINLKIKVSYALNPSVCIEQVDGLNDTEKRVIDFLCRSRRPVTRDKLLEALDLALDSPVPEKLVKRDLLVKESNAIRMVGDASRKMVRLRETEDPPKLTPKQKSVYRVLCDVGTASVKELCYFTGSTPTVVDKLVSKNLAAYYDVEVYRNPYQEVQSPQSVGDIVLSGEQQTAFQNLEKQYRSGTGGVSLLYGVTGSGKTSVFMKLIDRVYSQGRGVIVMVPEISLTPQTIFLFHQRYGAKVAVFHSGLTLAERLDEWKRVKKGDALIAVGTRSAVFAPFQNIGLIIMDEEQESTYKSESSPRYHARDIAKFRCAYHKALLVLCSATPSMESYFLAQSGRYTLNVLPERYGKAKLPEVTVVDMNPETENGNTSLYSSVLAEALDHNFKAGMQSIVLLNRRGYHTFASCKACGAVLSCPNCSISLTYHSANNRLMCHYCGYSIPFTKECPQCHENSVHYAGCGTQRAQEQLQQMFPEARILRLDTDSTMSRFAYEKKLRLFSEGAYDMIVGTQMVAKGLDFENVTLVGVLSADQALYGDDFRSYERAFDLLTQVVGRSGRGKYNGRAVIQTYTPENDVIRLAAEQNYTEFYKGEIAIRKAMLYPPFSDICMVGFVGNPEAKVRAASGCFLRLLSGLAQKVYPEQPMRVLSPTPALISKVSNKYRYKLIIKCRNCSRFREMISRILVEFSGNREFSNITAFIDMNPDAIM